MNSNKYLRSLNKTFFFLPLLLVLFFVNGCEEEKQKPAAVVKKKQRVMSGSTELYASDVDKITLNRNDSSLTDTDIHIIKKRNFGIGGVNIKGDHIEVSFDPSILTADSVKKIFSEFITI